MAFLFIIFAVMIDNIKNIVFTILNKEKVGSITITQFIDSCIKAQNKIFSSYFETESLRVKNRAAKGLSNGAKNLYMQKLKPFSVTAPVSITNGIGVIPSNCYFVQKDGIQHADIDGDIITSYMADFPEFKRFKSSDIFSVVNISGDSISIKPTTITSIDISYFRKPSNPKWTYTTVSGVPYFNKSDALYNDFDLHESEFSEIIREILSDFGIIKRDADLFKIIDSLKKIDEDDESRLL